MKSLFRKTIYNLKNGIFNLIFWFKIIWNDRNFDHSYIHKILHHKLTAMINSFEKNSYAVNAWYQIKYMKIAKSILEKLIEDNFLSEESDKLFDKNPDSDNLEDYFLLTPEKSKQLNELWKKQHELREKHIKTLYSIMSKRVYHWWD